MKHLFLTALMLGACAVGARADVKIGDPAPNFEAEFINADATSLADFKGKVVFVDFWRTW